MKIGILVYRINGIGGVERITVEKINAWIEVFGYEVVLITKNEVKVPNVYELNKKCKRYNLNIKAKLSGGILQYLKNIRRSLLLLNEIDKIVKAEQIDILFTYTVGIDSLIIPFLRNSVPKILEFHRSGHSLNKKAWFFKRFIIRKYDRVVLLTKNEIPFYKLNNVTVIPNFIDERSSKNNERRNIIISAGRIVPEKQFDHLVDIWSTIAAKHPDWEVHIYGSGNIETLNEKIDYMGLQESFKIFPATNSIRDIMAQSRIFVLTSESESFSMVLLEAMEAELPIISYDSPHGPKNIVTDCKDGFIVPLNDKVAFAQKLDLLISHSEFREEFIANQKSKLDFFSKERIMNQWNDLVLDVLLK